MPGFAVSLALGLHPGVRCHECSTRPLCFRDVLHAWEVLWLPRHHAGRQTSKAMASLYVYVSCCSCSVANRSSRMAKACTLAASIVCACCHT